MLCKHCGADVQDDARFCPVCGVQMEKPEGGPQANGQFYQGQAGGSNQQGNTYQAYHNGESYDRNNFFFSLSHPEEQWDQDMYQEAYQFMGENQAYYGRRFQKMQAIRATTDWNWCSFLFGGAWAFYRKMYIVGLIDLVASSILACIPVIGWLLSIGLSVCFGIWGNYLYMKHVQTSVCKYTRYPLQEKNLCYQSRGGVSVGAVFGAIGVNILIAAVPSILIGTLFGFGFWWL